MNKINLKNKKAFSLIELSIVLLIVGVIVAGVTQSSRLVSAFRISSAKTITTASPVVSTKNLLFWYETSSDASFLSSEAENLTVITQWNDINPQSTGKFNAYAGQKTNASAITYNLASSSTSGNTSGPTYIKDGINGIPTLRFTNAATTYKYLVADYSARNLPTDDMTMFLVIYYRSGDGWIIDRACNNNSNATYACFPNYNNGNPLFGAGFFSNNFYFMQRSTTGTGVSGSFYFDTGYDVSANRKYVITLERKYGVSWKAYVNGVVTSTTYSDVIGAIALDPVKIGRHADDNTSTSDFDLSELIFFTGPIKTSDRQAIEQYLGKKYGINI